MKLKEIASALEVLEFCGAMDTEINDIIVDSRKSAAGKLFVCIDGYTTDGHRFIGDAVKNGISALLVTKMPPKDLIGDTPVIRVADTRLAMAQASDKLHRHPSGRLNLIGITGTKGKTTTSYMLRAIYTAQKKATGLIGTIQNMIGDEVLHTDRTTPEANELQKLLDEMTERGIEDCIMEVSSQGLHLNRVACCEYRAAVFTNLSRDHIGPSEHADMDDYANAKARLFAMSEIAVLNRDNPYWQVMASQAAGKIYTFGINEADCDFKAVNIVKAADHVEFDIESKDGAGNMHLYVPIPGNFTVYNAMSAAVTAYLLGVGTEFIQEGLRTVFVPGKAEIVPTGRDFSVLIDYAHNPDSFINIITTVKEYAKRTVFLFGCGGDRNRPRFQMGETAGKYADFSIITSDNPRTEDPASIVKDLEEGMKSTGAPYICIVDRREAIQYAVRNAQPGDVIILAGKGHETYQIFKDKTVHFDEREVVREALAELPE
jgi:UDP-N-acetylmuramoyl-L-alanyl-D-glutamate--2,6-diaminopimelate ligase